MSQVFSFQDHPVRTITIDGQPWFIGRDIASLLGYAKPHQAVREHCKHVKLFKGPNLGHLKITSPRGILLIPEADVWRLLTRSTLPKALEVEEWIMGEVLPAIRKTGKYEAKPKQKALPAPKPSLPALEPSLQAEWLQAYGDFCKASRIWETVNDRFWQLTNSMRNDEFRRGGLSRLFNSLDLLADTLWMQQKMGFTVDRAMKSAKELAIGMK